MNEIMDFYTVECYCGISHRVPQKTDKKLTCICGRSINGLFGVDFQRKVEDQTKMILETVRIGRLSMFTTEELADEVARRVKETGGSSSTSSI